METSQIIALVAMGVCCMPLLIMGFVAVFMCISECIEYRKDSKEDRKKRKR